MPPRRLCVAGLMLAGCNAVFGLDGPALAIDAGGPDATDGPDASPRTPGVIGAFSYDYARPSGAVSQHTIDAFIGPSPATCTELRRTGGCVAGLCDDVTLPDRPDAGQLTLTGTQSVTILPSDNGSYPTTTGPGPLFAAADSLTIVATGGDVPSFATSLPTPAPVTFTNPMPSLDSAPMPVVRQAGLTLTWSGGAADTLITLTITSASSPVVIYCAFDGIAGAALVERAVLDELPPGLGAIYSGVLRRQGLTIDDFAIELQALVVGKRADGDWAAGPLALE